MRQLTIFLKVLLLVLLLAWQSGSFIDLNSYLEHVQAVNINTEFFHTIGNFLLFALSINLLRIFYFGIYRRRLKVPKGHVDNVVIGLNNIYILLMAGAVVATVLSLFGIDFQSLFTGLSIVAAAIAIITKDFIANIISGIAITFSKEFSIGDFIRIGEHKGKVTDITISKTALVNDDDDVIYIPNNHFFLHDFLNHTKKGIRTVNIDFEVNLNSIETIDELEKDLIQALEEFHVHIEAKSFKLRVEDIKKDSLALKFQYVLKRTNRAIEREIRKKTVRRVVNHIRKDKNAEGAAEKTP